LSKSKTDVTVEKLKKTRKNVNKKADNTFKKGVVWGWLIDLSIDGIPLITLINETFQKKIKTSEIGIYFLSIIA